jgi:hypothetical protein
MDIMLVKCGTCFRSPLNCDTAFLLSDPESARIFLERVRAVLEEQGIGSVDVVFNQAKREAKWRYATSEDDDDSVLLDPLLRISNLQIPAATVFRIEGIITASEFPASMFHDRSIDLYIYDNLFGILEWDFTLGCAGREITAADRPAIELLLHAISVELMEAITQIDIFSQIHAAAVVALPIKALKGRKLGPLYLEREQDYVDLLVRKKETKATSGLPVIVPSILWTARLYVWPHGGVDQEQKQFLPALLHKDTICVGAGGCRIYCAWGSGAIASDTEVDERVMQAVAGIRRELQYIFAVTNEYAKRTGSAYFRSLAGLTRRGTEVSDWLESAKTHLSQMLYICKDRDMGLQGWKSECFVAYMRLWKVEPYIATTVNKVDTARNLVETIRAKQGSRMQRQIKNILAALGLMEALGVITEITEYSHSPGYRPSATWGILRVFHYWRPDATISVAALLILSFLVAAILYIGTLKE